MRLILVAIILNSIFCFGNEVNNDFQIDKRTLAFFADLIDDHMLTRQERIRYNDIKVLEFLIYKERAILKALEEEQYFEEFFSGNRKLIVDNSNKTMLFTRGKHGRKVSIKLTLSESQYKWEINKKDEGIVIGSFNISNIDQEYYSLIKNKIYNMTIKHRGFSTVQKNSNIALNSEGNIQTDFSENKERKSILLRIKEKFYRKNQFDNTEWTYVPVKLISYPAQKIMYEVPEFATSLVVESVTRAPLHNLLGAVDEAKGAGKSFINGFEDIFRGILNPKKATMVDGSLLLIDGGYKVVKFGGQIIKSVVSLIGYPLYRIFGGKKSQRVPLRGRRATIVVIDTGLGPITDEVMDSYGETIVRNQLKSLSSHYCVSSNPEENSIYDCIDSLPNDVRYIDFFALTHTGGTSELNHYAKYAAENRGFKPELMVSIGCYDNFSEFTESENTLGQQGTSWAVHFYLSNLISKRLRGIPMQQAANEAFYSSMPINLINPLSIGAVAMLGIGERNLKEGYYGSKPDLQTEDIIIKDRVFDNLEILITRSLYSQLGDEYVDNLFKDDFGASFKNGNFLNLESLTNSKNENVNLAFKANEFMKKSFESYQSLDDNFNKEKVVKNLWKNVPTVLLLGSVIDLWEFGSKVTQNKELTVFEKEAILAEVFEKIELIHDYLETATDLSRKYKNYYKKVLHYSAKRINQIRSLRENNKTFQYTSLRQSEWNVAG